MSANAYNPKVSVLVKLAEIFHLANTSIPVAFLPAELRTFLDDPEILEWYDRMAELQHVPERRGVPAIHESTLALAIEDKLKSDPVIAEATQGRIFSTALEAAGYPEIRISQVAINDAIAPRVGYQTFATQSKNHEAVDVASYTEATSVEEAMQKCLQEFAGPEYFNHGVKDIETQVVTMAAYKTVLDLD